MTRLMIGFAVAAAAAAAGAAMLAATGRRVRRTQHGIDLGEQAPPGQLGDSLQRHGPAWALAEVVCREQVDRGQHLELRKVREQAVAQGGEPLQHGLAGTH